MYIYIYYNYTNIFKKKLQSAVTFKWNIFLLSLFLNFEGEGVNFLNSWPNQVPFE